MAQPTWTDEQMDQVLGNLLRAGVILATAVMLIGGVLYLIDYGFDVHDYQTFHVEPLALTSLGGVVGEALQLHSRGIIVLAVLLLIATPIARVAFSVFAFLRQRDGVYVLVTLVVLGVLLFSIFGGRI